MSSLCSALPSLVNKGCHKNQKGEVLSGVYGWYWFLVISIFSNFGILMVGCIFAKLAGKVSEAGKEMIIFLGTL